MVKSGAGGGTRKSTRVSSRKATRRDAVKTSGNRSAKLAAERQQLDKASRIRSVLKSPAVRNVVALGLASAAAALMYKRSAAPSNQEPDGEEETRGLPQAKPQGRAKQSMTKRATNKAASIGEAVSKLVGDVADKSNIPAGSRRVKAAVKTAKATATKA